MAKSLWPDISVISRLLNVVKMSTEKQTHDDCPDEPITKQPGLKGQQEPPPYADTVGGSDPPPNYVIPGQLHTHNVNMQIQGMNQGISAGTTLDPPRWCDPAPPISGVRPGLQYLVSLDKVTLNEDRDLTKSKVIKYLKYNVLSPSGDKIFSAEEESPTNFQPGYIPIFREFKVRFRDLQAMEVMTISRDRQRCAHTNPFCTCISPCAASAEITSGGTCLGTVRQILSCYIHYAISDAEGVEKVQIDKQGPFGVVYSFTFLLALVRKSKP